MTLDATLFRESKSFIDPHKKTLYPVKIPVQHYQLRHFISTVDEDIVYYACNNEVYAVHIPSGKRERIAALDFPIQCLGAAFGWICVGGHHGRCAFIDISETSLFTSLPPYALGGAEVDSLLPLNLDPTPRAVDDLPDPHPPRTYSKPIHVKVYHREIGSDIVNSITLHRLRTKQKGINEEKIAVISTNDHTVQIFSLHQLQILKVLEFPTYMNHASISPDGSLLVACGDETTAFFFRRKRVAGLVTEGSAIFARYDWETLATAKLTTTVPSDTCFSTAFSPSGHICTVSSQFGTVTVFDTSLIREGMEDEEAVIDTFTSSRPAVVPEEMAAWMPGAVRSSAFSPEPWDLFAWAEDRGRVCIADLRDGFRSRQLIELNPRDPEVDCVDVTDLDGTLDPEIISERFTEDSVAEYYRHLGPVLHGEVDGTERLQSADQVERAAERRRRVRNAEEEVSTDFTDIEPQILQETLATERLQDFSAYSSPSSLRDYIRERNQDRGAQSRTHYPRRRSSVVISNSNAAGPSSSRLTPLTSSTTLSTSPSRLSSTIRTPATADGTAPSIPPFTNYLDNSLSTTSYADAEDDQYANYLAPSTDPWQTISNAMAIATSPAPPAENPYSGEHSFPSPSPYAHSAPGAEHMTEEDQRSALRDLQRRDRVIREERLNLTRRLNRQRSLEEERHHSRRLIAAGTRTESGPEPVLHPNGNTYLAILQRREFAQRQMEGRDPPLSRLNPQHAEENGVAQRSLLGPRMRLTATSGEPPRPALERLDRARLTQLRALRERSAWLSASGHRPITTGRLADEEDVSVTAGSAGSSEGLATAAVAASDAIATVTDAADMRNAHGLTVGQRTREYGVAVQGLGWSRDGRSLWVTIPFTSLQ